MKGLKSTIILLLIAGSTGLFGQADTMSQYASDHYRVYTNVSAAYAQALGEKMEAALTLFNDFLNFDLTTIETKFKVVIYKDKSDFDDHLSKLLGQTREDFVYIHYSDQLKSELVGFYKNDSDSMNISLLHQGFIQFLKAFVPNAPIWLSEGMAAYLETSSYSIDESTKVVSANDSSLEMSDMEPADSAALKTETAEDTTESENTDSESPDTTETTENTADTAGTDSSSDITSPDRESTAETTDASDDTTTNSVAETTPTDNSDIEKKFTLNKSLSWLDNLKSILNGNSGVVPYKIEDLVTLDRTQAVSNLNVFYPQAWGLVYFLLNSNSKAYNRMIWDSISYLQPGNSLTENSNLLKKRVFGKINSSKLNKDYKSFISSQKTFYELVTEGIEFYNKTEYSKALEYFTKALDLKPNNFYPSYYLGLTYYALKDYYKAESYYKKAIENGADKALTYYAMGVNAYADNNYTNANTYLTKALELDAEKYEQKVKVIKDRIETEAESGM